MDKSIAVLIPSLNPDEGIVSFLSKLRSKCNYPFIVVNDGSASQSSDIFARLKQINDCTILEHSVNLGKGRALKTGFNFYLLNFSGNGVVTADGDGQHDCDDIIKCAKDLEEDKSKLILGVRDFSSTYVPWKSSLGNNLTKAVLTVCLRTAIRDTQTGLRAIPSDLLRILMNSYGERFEFETVMLFDARNNGYQFKQNTIETIYEDNNRGTHFDPFRDSLKIYGVIVRYSLSQIAMFAISGGASAVLDLGLFALLFHKAFSGLENARLFLSVLIARACSLCFNYWVNKNIVFKSSRNEKKTLSFLQYLLLCVFVFTLSYSLTKLFNILFAETEITFVKLMVDIVLFLLSYSIQKHFIFK